MRAFLLAALLALAAVPPLASGENLGDVTIEDTTFRLTYDMWMQTGSTLTLRNATIEFAGGTITVDAGARMVMDRGAIVQVPGYAQGDVLVNGELDMRNSSLVGTGGFESLAGRLHVQDSTFTGNTLAIFAYRTAVVDVTRSTFTNNSAGGVEVRDATLRVSHSTFDNNDGAFGSVTFISTVAGSAIFGEAQGHVLHSTIRNGNRGVHTQGADHGKVEVAHNCLRENGYGVSAQDDSNPNVHHNAIVSNTYAYHNFGAVSNGAPWTADVRENWWGTASGPSASGPNSVTGSPGVTLLTSPWLASTPVTC